MRAAFFYSTILSTMFMALGASTPIQAQTYAISEPMIISCPDGYKGEMTVVETNQTQFPWQLLRWNCQGLQGLVQKYDLEQYLQKNPPAKTASRRWEEKCPSGSVGVVLFNSHESRRFVESWTCSLDGVTKMSFEDLKKMLEHKPAAESVSGASGVTQQRNCPNPYQGTFTRVFRSGKWDLVQWTCVAPGAKNRVPEATMRMLLPSQ